MTSNQAAIARTIALNRLDWMTNTIGDSDPPMVHYCAGRCDFIEPPSFYTTFFDRGASDSVWIVLSLHPTGWR